MNIVLLITIMFTLASVHGYNDSPCQRNFDNNAYNRFVKKHILQELFNRQSETEWRGYLIDQKLCNRRRQSFIEERDQQSVEQICNGSGWPLYNSYQGNLCISASHMLVYYVEVGNNDCTIRRLEEIRTYVIVACDEVAYNKGETRCCPVHFEEYRNQKPNRTRHCRPRP